MYCKGCGKKMREGVDICPYCGSFIIAHKEQPVVERPVAEDWMPERPVSEEQTYARPAVEWQPPPPQPAAPKKPRFHTASLVMGILSLCFFCLPGYGATLALIGLPMACISKRQSSIILNIIGLFIGIVVYVIYVLEMAYGIGFDPFFDPFIEPF